MSITNQPMMLKKDTSYARISRSEMKLIHLTSVILEHESHQKHLRLCFINFNSLEYQITTHPTKPFEEHILKGLNLSIQKLQHLLHSPS
mmetsp:Transcript_17762/g.27887  ORF Transcript_17762/g.27887 Transcript_17762/m.27887 type:complete len:89 (-) Transcript_17762:1757-2023(-)